ENKEQFSSCDDYADEAFLGTAITRPTENHCPAGIARVRRPRSGELSARRLRPCPWKAEYSAGAESYHYTHLFFERLAVVTAQFLSTQYKINLNSQSFKKRPIRLNA